MMRTGSLSFSWRECLPCSSFNCVCGRSLSCWRLYQVLDLALTPHLQRVLLFGLNRNRGLSDTSSKHGKRIAHLIPCYLSTAFFMVAIGLHGETLLDHQRVFVSLWWIRSDDILCINCCICVCATEFQNYLVQGLFSPHEALRHFHILSSPTHCRAAQRFAASWQSVRQSAPVTWEQVFKN